ncbi:MAG: phenylalanine--tRNA ligase subunit beta [Sandaracinus sp.]|nr:phenylalanine--tRNA ligase subunit beta [Sandaracinus sp.]
MRVSYRWLKELLPGLEATPDEVAEKLTSVGLEVEEMHRFVAPEKVVVAKVLAKSPHPNRDKLTLVRVFDGAQEIEVVCGASNVPAPGGHVLFAQLGARLPTADGSLLEIGERKLGGVVSCGMICAEDELGLGDDHEGIFVFGEHGAPEAPAPGTSLADALPTDDVAFEISLTPNRPDCLGHLGVARDLAAVFGLPFARPAIRAKEVASGVLSQEGHGRLHLEWHGDGVGHVGDLDLSGFRVDLPDPARCPRYGAAFVVGVKDGASPFWLRHRLHVLGHRSISALVDATNLVMLETGHPIHGFDLERLRGGRIEVRLAHQGETMKTLDEVERTFTSDDLLICDGEGPVAVAGVMGGLESEMGAKTRHVAIECAYFDARSVRRTSRRLGLHTDASHRFERGVDPNDVPWVLARAAALMAELGGGVAVREALDVYPVAIEPTKITMTRARASLLLGYDVPRDVPAKVLAALGCEILDDGDDAITVHAPTWRPDLGREADLVEEVGRIHGYEHVPTTIPAVRPSRVGTSAALRFERRLRETAASVGLHEAVCYGFVPRDEALALVPSGAQSPLSDLVALQNPLGGRDVMRPSLLPGLANAASVALRHQATSANLFELGRIFRAREGKGDAAWGLTHHSKDEDVALPREQPAIGLLLVGERPAWIGEAGDYDFFDARGRVEALVHAMTGLMPSVRTDATLDAPYLHPTRRARLFLGDFPIGVIGEVHPDVAERFDLGDRRPQYVELDVRGLFAASTEVPAPKATEPPRIPAVTRDVALLVPSDVQAGALEACLREGAGGLAEDVRLFDVYTGKGLPEGTKSLAFRLRYRDRQETLTDKRVDAAHAAAIAATKKLGASPR